MLLSRNTDRWYILKEQIRELLAVELRAARVFEIVNIEFNSGFFKYGRLYSVHVYVVYTFEEESRFIRLNS